MSKRNQKKPGTTRQQVKSSATQAAQSVAEKAIEQKVNETEVDEVTEAVETSPEPLKDVVKEEAEEVTGNTQSDDQIQKVKEPKYIGKFWFGNVHIPGVGTMSGEVREDHLAKFKEKFESAQAKLPKADQITLKIDYWIRDTDELEKKTKEGKKVNP